MKTILLYLLFSLFSISLFSQQEIPLSRSRKCDTAIALLPAAEVLSGKVTCIEDGRHNMVLYFSSKDEFEKYQEKYRALTERCAVIPKMSFDFDKYDLVFVWTEFDCFRQVSFKTIKRNGIYELNLNFFMEKNLKAPMPKEIMCTADLVYYSSYYLIPKSKNKPKFNLYDTYYISF